MKTTSPPAGLLVRLLALCYDGLVIAGVCFFATLIAVWLNGGRAFAANDPILSLYLLIVCFVFVGWCWTHGGQTPGMRAWKIRVMADDGLPLNWKQALVRYLAGLFSLGLIGCGYFWMLIDAEKCTWHDRASGTRVVYRDKG